LTALVSASVTASRHQRGGELVRASASVEQAPVPRVLRSRCERGCCAGSECKAAPAALMLDRGLEASVSTVSIFSAAATHRVSRAA
jgi:hypothetical protein